jgi:hypothetical protein
MINNQIKLKRMTEKAFGLLIRLAVGTQSKWIYQI